MSASQRRRFSSLLLVASAAASTPDGAADAVGSEKEVRVLHGPLGPFAGDDFPCAEKDVFRDAPWAHGACMLSCRGRDRTRLCSGAIQLCRRLAVCASVNVNVEGTVATLKRETELSAKTSKVFIYNMNLTICICIYRDTI